MDIRVTEDDVLLCPFKAEGGVAPVAPTEFDVPADLDKGPVSDEDASEEAADALNDGNDNKAPGASA